MGPQLAWRCNSTCFCQTGSRPCGTESSHLTREDRHGHRFARTGDHLPYPHPLPSGLSSLLLQDITPAPLRLLQHRCHLLRLSVSVLLDLPHTTARPVRRVLWFIAVRAAWNKQADREKPVPWVFHCRLLHHTDSPHRLACFYIYIGPCARGHDARRIAQAVSGLTAGDNRRADDPDALAPRHHPDSRGCAPVSLGPHQHRDWHQGDSWRRDRAAAGTRDDAPGTANSWFTSTSTTIASMPLSIGTFTRVLVCSTAKILPPSVTT